MFDRSILNGMAYIIVETLLGKWSDCVMADVNAGVSIPVFIGCSLGVTLHTHFIDRASLISVIWV